MKGIVCKVRCRRYRVLITILKEIDTTMAKPDYSKFRDSTDSEFFSEVYASLFENHPDAAYIINQAGEFVAVNPAAEVLTGYSQEDIFKTTFHQFVAKEDLAEAEHRFNLTLKGAPQKYDIGIYHRNGHRLEVNVTNIPILVQGEIIGVFGIARNITEFKQDLEQRQAELQLLNSIFNNITDAIAVIDLDEKYIGVNQAFEQMFGWHRDELIGHPLKGNTEDYANLLSSYHRLAKLGKATEFEIEKICKDGRKLPIEIALSPLRDERGNVVALAGIIRDITDRKRAEQRLIRAKKLAVAEEMAAGVAHEIFNPLTSLHGFVQLMQEDENNHSHPYLDIMSGEIKRIEEIISELLILAKPQAVSMEPINLSQLTYQIVDSLQEEFPNIEWRIEPSEGNLGNLGDLGILGNREQIGLMLGNLLRNAAESMENRANHGCAPAVEDADLDVTHDVTHGEVEYGGTVTITMVEQAAQGQVRLTIEDQGCGIEPSVKARLGEPFYTTKSKGTGLGLMTSYKIAENHRGKIVIDSEVNQGTTVQVHLPTTKTESDT